MQKKYSNIKWLFLLRIVISIIVLILGFFFALSKKYFDTGYNKIASFSGVEAIELSAGDTLEQSIYFLKENVDNIGICAVNRTSNCTGSIEIALWENQSVIWEQMVDIEDLALKKIVWFLMRQSVDTQKEYTLKLSADQMEGILLIAGIAEEENAAGVAGNVIKNSEKLGLSMVVESTFRTRLNRKTRMLIILWAVIIVIYILGFEKLFLNRTRGIITLFVTVDIFAVSTYFRFGLQFDESLNYVMFLGLILAFAVVAIVYSVLLLRKCEKAEVYFVISSLVFGMIFSIILPPFSAPDEDFHFAEAYRLSNAIMGQPINDQQGYIYMRECDVRNYEWYPDNEYTINMVKMLIRGDKEYSENMVPSNSYKNTYVPIVMYVPQAVGITIGRLLHLNYSRVVFAGRWINLFTFIAIATWAIKLIPYGKWILFAVCQIPLLVELISSYSYDILILSGTFLLVAYIMKLCCQEERITIKQVWGIVLYAAVYGPLKPVYIPLIALVFLIPDKKLSNWKWKSLVLKSAIVAIAVISFLLVNKCRFMSMRWIENPKSNMQVEATFSEDMMMEEMERYDIEDRDPCNRPNLLFLMDNPFDMPESYMGAFLAFMDEYILSLFGNYLGWYHVRIPIYISILAMMLLYMSYIVDDGVQYKVINIKGRLWVIFLMAGSCFAAFLSMYMKNTSPSNKLIIGVQGRYILPILAVLPFFLHGKHLGNELKKTNIVMLSLTIQILAVLAICAYIW